MVCYISHIKLYLKFYIIVKVNFDVSLKTGIILINLVVFTRDEQKSKCEENL